MVYNITGHVSGFLQTFPAERFAAGQVGKLGIPESSASHGGFAPLLR
jgi:hypothetical protein